MTGRDGEDVADAGYGESSRYAAHLDRGWALLDRGDLAAARTSVEHAEEARPDDPDATVLLGAIALAEGRPEESLRCYERALELDPDYLEPYVAAAQVCLFDLDDPVRALHYCVEALELEGLTPFEALDLQLMAAECELVLGDETAARTRVSGMTEVGVLDLALAMAAKAGPVDEEDPQVVAANAFLTTDHDGEPLDEDERVDRIGRALHLSMRLARLRLDCDDMAGALRELEHVVELFPGEADAWYLMSEAGHRAGDPQRVSEAGLRTLELDATEPLPRWVPSPAVLQRRVVQIIKTCPVLALAELVLGDRPLPVLVADHPPAELVAEGLDPRIVVLALAGRVGTGDDGDRPLVLTGIAVYRRNLARFAREQAQLEQELRLSLFEELAAFCGLGDADRTALGLAPVSTTTDVQPTIVPSDDDDDDAEAAKANRRRGRRRSRTLN